MKSCNKINSVNRVLAMGVFLCAIIFSSTILFGASDQQRFNSADDAVSALVNAAKGKDTNSLHSIFGSDGEKLISPDVVQAADELETFVKRVAEKVEIVPQSDSRAVLQLGSDGWPFPIPLVKEKDHWFFDTKEGAQEILNRRIGRNELQTIEVCRAYLDAQREYASRDHDGDDVLEYAQKLRSSEGKQDGLYWSFRENNEQSPLGPLISESRAEGYRGSTKILTEEPTPYHGYYFKILTKQGKHAAGGKYDYVINGNMIGGFALVAWPAEWGNSGVMTFIVNQQGKVWQKNLGSKTSTIAARMSNYDPDSTWQPVQDD